MSLSRKRTHVISSRLWRQLLQELHVELDSADERCIFLSSQQLRVHALIGFQHLLILIAAIKQEVVHGVSIVKITSTLDTYTRLLYHWAFLILPHLGFRFTVVISLISCSSRKEKLGSNTPINFITSWRFSPEVGPVATSVDSADSAGSDSLSCRTRGERIKML